MAKPWTRLRRRHADTRPDPADDTVRVAGSTEHAWWADREHLEHAYAPPLREESVADEEAPRRETFSEYFTPESLFSSRPAGPSPEAESEEPEEMPAAEGWWDGADPYIVLGIPETSTWEEITAAHRRLAKLHHPDRLLHATDEDRARSERRMRELNIAYSELRRRRGR